MTRRSRQIQKQKFGVMCPGVLIMETALGPPEHEKECVDILCPKCIGMHYVIRRSNRIQKHKFVVTCLNALFVESVPVPHEHENSVSIFCAMDALQCTT
jgi:hypothetical protein